MLECEDVGQHSLGERTQFDVAFLGSPPQQVERGGGAADSGQGKTSRCVCTIRREAPAFLLEVIYMPSRTVPTPRRRYVSALEAADYLGVSDRTIRQMVSDGRLTAYRNGRGWSGWTSMRLAHGWRRSAATSSRHD